MNSLHSSSRDRCWGWLPVNWVLAARSDPTRFINDVLVRPSIGPTASWLLVGLATLVLWLSARFAPGAIARARALENDDPAGMISIEAGYWTLGLVSSIALVAAFYPIISRAIRDHVRGVQGSGFLNDIGARAGVRAIGCLLHAAYFFPSLVLSVVDYLLARPIAVIGGASLHPFGLRYAVFAFWIIGSIAIAWTYPAPFGMWAFVAGMLIVFGVIRRWLVQDQLGSVIAVANSGGASIATNTYDEYGEPGSSNTGRFQYTGQMWIGEAGLYHYKARAYLPNIGRFAQADPILYAGGLNLYTYVGNNPNSFTDPYGLQAQEPEPDGGFPVSEEPDLVITAIRDPNSMLLASHGVWGGYYTSIWSAINRARSRPARSPSRIDKIPLEEGEIVVTATPREDAEGAEWEEIQAYLFVQPRWVPWRPFKPGDRLLPHPGPEVPRPPGWTPDWKWGYGNRTNPRSGPRWFDPRGGEWRWHSADRHHPNGHWDFNPWTHPSSPWQNVDPVLVLCPVNMICV